MWRLPFSNLCFVVILITLVAVRHSVFLFHPGKNSGGDHSYGSLSTQPNRAVEPASGDASTYSEVRMPIRKLIEWWQKSVMLREWMLEYYTPYWGKVPAVSQSGAALAEARFYAANAAVLDAVMGDRERATLELTRAATILLDRKPLIADKLLPTLETIRREVNDAIVDPMTNSANWQRYEKIKTDLDHLIKAIRLSEL